MQSIKTGDEHKQKSQNSDPCSSAADLPRVTAVKEQAQKKHRGFLQRFALVLQAKIDKASLRWFPYGKMGPKFWAEQPPLRPAGALLA